MSEFMAVKALAGLNYVRADQVVAIATSDPTKCSIYLVGGVTIPCSEPAKEVIARLAAANLARGGEPAEEPK
jgi:hypothetical protein